MGRISGSKGGVEMTEKKGVHYCWISGNIKQVGDMCEHNPNVKHKCRECVNMRFMKFK